MKTAQELRVGNIIMLNQEAFVVQKTESTRSLRTDTTVKMKLRSLTSRAVVEAVHRGDDKFPVVLLERKACIYSYFADPYYVFMDESFHQYELDAESLENILPFLEDQMSCELVFFQDQPISVELPPVIVREITYTEPAVRGDTTGKLTKPAQLASGFTLPVAAFCETGDKIDIDTKTNSFIRKRLPSR